MHVFGGSHIGQRKDNEDSFEIIKLSLSHSEEACFLVVADGMGGHEHGQLASKMAVDTFSALEKADSLEHITLDHIQQLFQEANRNIHLLQHKLQDGIIGTTLTVAAIEQNQLYLGHIGDSRCYLYRNHLLDQISIDHTYYAELIRLGQEITANDEKQKNMLMKALGPELEVEGQYMTLSLEPHDMIMLCTDGFYNAVDINVVTSTLTEVVSGSLAIQPAVERLLENALQNGARDNLTLMLYLHTNQNEMMSETN